MSVLKTRLFRPLVPDSHIVRERISALLTRNWGKQVILVVAPAGYGKSVAVSQWLKTNDFEYGWISLEEDFNDIRFFVEYLCEAVKMTYPDAMAETGLRLKASQLPPHADLLQVLLNDLDALPRSFLLVLDDFHVIRDSSVFRLMNDLMKERSDKIHYVIIAREEPQLRVAALKAYGRVFELGVDELRFDEKEICEFASQGFGQELNDGQFASLKNLTEGWVVGLRLVMLGVQNGLSIEAIERRLQSNLSQLSEYLLEEVISKQPQFIQECLMATSVLDRFNQELIEVLLGDDEETGRARTAQFFPYLFKHNLFIVPVDHELKWFRYHHLFREFLMSRLFRDSSAEEVLALHRRAGKWFAKHEFYAEAIKHLIASGDIDGAVELINRQRYGLIEKEQFYQLGRLLELFPASVSDDYLPLVLTRALSRDSTADYAAMAADLAIAGKLITRLGLDVGSNRALLGEYYSILACYAFMTGDKLKSREYAKNALELLGPLEGYIRDHALAYYVSSLQLTGSGKECIRVLEKEKSRYSSVDIGGRVRFQTIRALTYSIQLRLKEMEEAALDYHEISRKNNLLTMWARGTYLLAAGYYLQNRLDEIEDILEPLFLLRDVGRPHWVLRCYFIKCLVLLAKQKEIELFRTIEEMYSWAGKFESSSPREIAYAIEVEIALRQGRTEYAWSLAKFANFNSFPAAYLFHIPQLTKVKLWIESGKPAYMDQAGYELEKLVISGRSEGNFNLLFFSLALQAVFYCRKGRNDLAQISIGEALVIGECGNILRVFVDMGPEMEALLREQGQNHPQNEYLQRILAVFENVRQKHLGTVSGAKKINLLVADGFSERELEILGYLAGGFRNQEIAEKLFLSLDTIKGYLYRLYQKLDVKNRVSAVIKARDLGLIQEV